LGEPPTTGCGKSTTSKQRDRAPRPGRYSRAAEHHRIPTQTVEVTDEMQRISLLTISLLFFVVAANGVAEESSAQRGYRLLLEKPYVPAYFDQETFDDVWRTWPKPLRSRAEKASAAERRKMAFARYGLTLRPGDESGKPLQFVIDQHDNWVPNCFTCHGGMLLGRVIPGLPNSHYALQTLIQETRLTKIRLRKPLQPIDFGSLVMPLGGTVGTTNAVIFGVALARQRDKHLNLVPASSLPNYLHHDMDAPPWWHFRKKARLYLDGFAVKDHRPLMQFALDHRNGPEKFREWEDDFRHIHAYLMSLEPPRYAFEIDHALAREGQTVFERVCAECHGTYGPGGSYPTRIVPIDEIGTDRARIDALTPKHREDYRENWFSHYGRDDVIVDPGGYVAPPLDGVWASAPYLHNGSVPTLWHMLHPDDRPVVWKRKGEVYDRQRVGFEIEAFGEMPTVRSITERRHYFNTTAFSKSAAGHLFPEVLTEPEKIAALEYLKTL